MRVLVIGGTVFLGRAVVEAALERGDEVTYFHRGRHGRGLHAGAEDWATAPPRERRASRPDRR